MGPRELLRAARVSIKAQETLLAVLEGRSDPHEMTAEEAEVLESIVGVGKAAFEAVAPRVAEFETQPVVGVRPKKGRLLTEGGEGT